MRPHHIHAKGIWTAIAAFSAFAIGDADFKYLTTVYNYEIIDVLFCSALFNVLILLAASRWLGGLKETLRGPDVKLHLFRGLLLLVQLGSIVYGFTHQSMVKTYAIVFVAPFITTLLSVQLFRERVGAVHWLAITAGFAGVLIVLRPGMVPLDLATMSTLLSATLFSFSNILSRIIGRNKQTLLSWGLLTELPILAISAALAAKDFTVPGLVPLLLIFILSVLSLIGVIGISRAFILAPPSIAAPFHYVQMLWAIVLGYALFGEHVDLATGIGSAIIIASGIWLLKLDEKPQSSAAP
jgi:drug/metabolite transporter (DMT)-like permease